MSIEPAPDDVVLAAGYMPIGLWLGPATCLVYTGEVPDPQAMSNMVAGLTGEGLREIEVAEDLQAVVLSLTMARVQDISGLWAVWSKDDDTARAAITGALATEM